MARFQLPNKSYIRQDDSKYLQALQSMEDAINRLSDQTNADPTGASVAPPAPISGISVAAQNGIHDISINDNNPAYRGIRYAADYSTTPDFQNFHTIDMGTSQNLRKNMGPGQFYWRASNRYPASDPASHAYHGGATPEPVGEGNYNGPPMSQQQGFNGKFRNSSTPPVRK